MANMESNSIALKSIGESSEAMLSDPRISSHKSAAVLLSHPTGNQNVRNALGSLAEHGMLAEFWTTLAWNPHSAWNHLLPAGLCAQFARRSYVEAPSDRIKSVPWREMVRLGLRSAPLLRALSSGEGFFSVIGMYRHFDGEVAKRLPHISADAVYAYEGGALRTFRQARKLGLRTIYEQPSSYWYWVRNLLSEEAARCPEFADLLPNLKDSSRHLAWKDEELSLADYVIVPSDHVRRTLAGVVPMEKIRVINYGAPPVRGGKRVSLDRRQPLKVLFVGGLTQHKGIGYLLEAVDRLGSQVELTLVGRRFGVHDRVDNACNRWRWFDSLPYSRVLEIMRTEADVLVLPSFGEGFGLVISEALACGVPVIITPNVGASDMVVDEREAFVVPVASSEAIADRLLLLARDRELLSTMSIQARATAAQNSWESYRATWANLVRELC